jgi:hypothetical protein
MTCQNCKNSTSGYCNEHLPNTMTQNTTLKRAEIKEKLRVALRFPEGADLYATDMDSRGSLDRAVEVVLSQLSLSIKEAFQATEVEKKVLGNTTGVYETRDGTITNITRENIEDKAYNQALQEVANKKADYIKNI